MTVGEYNVGAPGKGTPHGEEYKLIVYKDATMSYTPSCIHD